MKFSQGLVPKFRFKALKKEKIIVRKPRTLKELKEAARKAKAFKALVARKTYLSQVTSQKLRYVHYLQYFSNKYSKYRLLLGQDLQYSLFSFSGYGEYVKNFINEWWAVLKFSFYQNRHSSLFINSINFSDPNYLYNSKGIFSIKKPTQTSVLDLYLFSNVKTFSSATKSLALQNRKNLLLLFSQLIFSPSSKASLSTETFQLKSFKLLSYFNSAIYSLKTWFSLNFKLYPKINLRFLKKYSLTSAVGVRFLAYHLLSKKPLFYALNQFRRFLGVRNTYLNKSKQSHKTKAKLTGFRLLCKGKLSKRPRAMSERFDFGSLGLSSVLNYLDSYTAEVSLKYGRCHLHLILNKRKTLYYKNYTYNFFQC